MTETADFPAVASLWMGGALSWVEQTCLLSFVRLGQRVILYHYHDVSAVPPGVELRDARDIWAPPETLVEQTAPSYIADLFRIHLMQHSDHIWVDADTIALAPLTPDADGFLVGAQAQISGAILRLPQGSETLSRLVELTQDMAIVPSWLPPEARDQLQALPLDQREAGRFHASPTVMGAPALTALMSETGEVARALPTDVLTPVPPAYADVLFNPHGGWEGWMTEATRAVPLWTSSRPHHRTAPPQADSFVGQLWQRVDPDRAMAEPQKEWSALPEGYRHLDQEAEAQGGLFIETPHHVIVYLPSDTPVRLLVSFDDTPADRLSSDHDPSGLALAKAEGWSFLGVLPKREDWFQCAQLAAAMEQMRATGLFDAYPAVSFLGHGRGGFGACLFAPLAPGSTLLTIAPTAPSDAPPEDALTGAATADPCLILHDPLESPPGSLVPALDRMGAVTLPTRHFGPDPRGVIQRSNLTSEILGAALTGTLSRDAFLERVRSKRRTSGAYLNRLFTTALNRGHVQLGLAAAEKSAKTFDNWKTRKARQSLKEALDANP